MVFPHLIYEIWSLQFLGTQAESWRIGRLVNEQTWSLVHHFTQFTNTSNLREWSMIRIMLILFSQEALLYVQEDNEALIKMFIKGRSPTMRHVSRTHRVASLIWLFDRINLVSKIQIKYNDTKNQLADIVTKGNFTRDEMESSFVCLTLAISVLQIVLKWYRKERNKDSGEERKVTAKFKPMMNVVLRCNERTPDVLPPTATPKAGGKPDMKVVFLWARGAEQHQRTGRPVVKDALTHQATQNGTLIKLGLLKSGNLMNWWKLEHGDLL